MSDAGNNSLPQNDAEWRARLNPEQYRVCRQRGTEEPFSGAYWNCQTPGLYHCVCCDAPLFDATAKFNANCGWPSFTMPTKKNAVTERVDHSMSMTRTEVICARCDAHLGHVFHDGPKHTGQRYCINSAALNLVEKKVV